MNTVVIEERVIQAPLTLDERIDDLNLRYMRNNKDYETLARDLVKLKNDFEMINLGQGFFNWRKLSIPKSTAHRLYQVGIALEHGVTALTQQDLQSAGSAIQNGVSVTEVKEAVQAGTITRKAQAAVSGGTVKLLITENGANEDAAALQKVSRVYAAMNDGSVVDKPEARELIMQFFNAIPEEAFKGWLLGAGIQAGRGD